ncbi:glycosyl hydrolase family 95 catalytic domain-containing protein [Cellulosimicrobium sp. Marseille-Q8652]
MTLAPDPRGALPDTELSAVALRYDAPAGDWSSEFLPLGNGRLGATLSGGLDEEVVQLNEHSLWGGTNGYDNALAGVPDDAFDIGVTGFGSYRAFGVLRVAFAEDTGVGAAEDGPGAGRAPGAAGPTGYRRALDPAVGIHTTTVPGPAGTVRREAFASHVADVLVLRCTTDAPSGLTATITLDSAQEDAPTVVDGQARRLAFRGVLANGLRHAATVQVIATAPGGGTGEQDGTHDGDHDGGHGDGHGSHEGVQPTVEVTSDGTALRVVGAAGLTVLVDARTDYRLSAAHGWRGEDPVPVLDAALAAAAARPFEELRAEHVSHVGEAMSRVHVDWGTSAPDVVALPTDRRLARYADGGEDPSLEQTLFAYGRYLLHASSRPGGLPANLQGLWNDENQPPWGCDYHTNINVQMNYWGAETTDLPETHEALAAFVEQVAVPSRVATRNAFGASTRGWTARTSQSIFGGNAWEWNTVASAWYAQHLYEHWAFTQDRAFLEATAYPVLREVCEFWEDRLVERPDGALVAPDGWSPEHGPREDGVMHDQQIVRDLFENYLDCAAALDADPDHRAVVAGLLGRLAPNRVGRWGQLQEWQEDRDDPEDLHRHTSHLFAVFPGRQITAATPGLRDAALVSLKARCGERDGVPFDEATVSGDSRRSWTWPWRAALFARLGDADRALCMVRGLLRFSTLPNLLATHPPMQLDGNLGITGAVAEMLLQSHDGFLHLLPALPAAWSAEGSFAGLRARGGYGVSARWRDGRVVSYDVVADRAPDARPVRVRVDGEDRRVVPAHGGAPMLDLGSWASQG